MKKMICLLMIILTSITISADSSSLSSDWSKWKNFQSSLNEKIVDADVLEDFWYGDDGVDCGEPTFWVTSIDFENRLIKLQVAQSAYFTYGCFRTPFSCEIAYSFTDRSIELEKLDMVRDCN